MGNKKLAAGYVTTLLIACFLLLSTIQASASSLSPIHTTQQYEFSTNSIWQSITHFFSQAANFLTRLFGPRSSTTTTTSTVASTISSISSTSSVSTSASTTALPISIKIQTEFPYVSVSQSFTITNTTSGGVKPYAFNYSLICHGASPCSQQYLAGVRDGNTFTFTKPGNYTIKLCVAGPPVAACASTYVAVYTVLPTISSTVGPSTTTSPITTSTSTILSGYSNATCGPGNSCMSQTELASLSGAGAYSAKYTQDPAIIADWISGSSNTPSILTGNVTVLWNVSYEVSGKNPNNLTREFVGKSPIAQQIYMHYLKVNTPGFNITNATLNGLTYSYTGISNNYLNYTAFLGYKDGTFVTVVSEDHIDSNGLASIISGDIP